MAKEVAKIAQHQCADEFSPQVTHLIAIVNDHHGFDEDLAAHETESQAPVAPA